MVAVNQLFRIYIESDFDFFLPRQGLIPFRAGDNRRFTAARLAKTLAEVDLDSQDIAFNGHLDIFHVVSFLSR